MTKDNTDNSENHHTESSNKPDMIAYTVEARGHNKSAVWTQVGAAWAHKDKKGFDVRCKALPVDGRLTLRFQGQVSGSGKPNNENEGVSPSDP